MRIRVPLVVYAGEERHIIGEAEINSVSGAAIIHPENPLGAKIAETLQLPCGLSFGFDLPQELSELVLRSDVQMTSRSKANCFKET